MATSKAAVLEPRKQPVQARSAATVDAILQATLQVLIAVGKERLTTTLVAQRAGVSVGTLYQYFPNKKSLLQAVLKHHLADVTEAVERSSAEQRGEPLGVMITAIVNAFFQAKMKAPRAALALYSVSSDVDGLRVTEDLRIRTVQALVDALLSSPEPLGVDAELAAFMLHSAITGVSRRILEAKVPVREHEAMRRELAVMLCSYVKAGVRE